MPIQFSGNVRNNVDEKVRTKLWNAATNCYNNKVGESADYKEFNSLLGNDISALESFHDSLNSTLTYAKGSNYEVIKQDYINNANDLYRFSPVGINAILENLKINKDGKEMSYAKAYGFGKVTTNEEANTVAAHIALNFTDGDVAQGKYTATYDGREVRPASEKALEQFKEEQRQESLAKGTVGKPKYPGVWVWFKSKVAKMFGRKNSESIKKMNDYETKLNAYNQYRKKSEEEYKLKEAQLEKDNAINSFDELYRGAETMVASIKFNISKNQSYNGLEERYKEQFKELVKVSEKLDNIELKNKLKELENKYKTVTGKVNLKNMDEVMKDNNIAFSTKSDVKRNSRVSSNNKKMQLNNNF